jgi:uncharacterized protein YwbE
MVTNVGKVPVVHGSYSPRANRIITRCNFAHHGIAHVLYSPRANRIITRCNFAHHGIAHVLYSPRANRIITRCNFAHHGIHLRVWITTSSKHITYLYDECFFFLRIYIYTSDYSGEAFFHRLYVYLNYFHYFFILCVFVCHQELNMCVCMYVCIYRETIHREQLSGILYVGVCEYVAYICSKFYT